MESVDNTNKADELDEIKLEINNRSLFSDSPDTELQQKIKKEDSVPSKDESRSTDADGLPEVQPGFPREKYTILDGPKIEPDLPYATYITSLTAYLTMRLALDPNVQDFTISVNDRTLKNFGKIIINLHYKGKKTKYAIQCRKVNTTITNITYLEEIKLYMDKQYERIAKLKTKEMDFKEIKFVILTTCRTGSDFCKTLTLPSKVLNMYKKNEPASDENSKIEIQLKPFKKKNDILNVTSESENIYSFQLPEYLCGKKKKEKDYDFPNVFLYTNQRVTPTMINQLLKSKFDIYPDITDEYTRYIENWRGGKLGGNYKLKKCDVILKIGELLLGTFLIIPKQVQSNQNSFKTWNKVIEQFDLTVVENEPYVINKICQPFNQIIEKKLQINIDIKTNSIDLSKLHESSLKDPIKSYLFEVVQDLHHDLSLHSAYIIFWKAGDIPLLLSSEGREDKKGFILDVILFMKQMGVNKKFLLQSADLNLTKYKTSLLKIFTSLDDIKNIIHLEELHISSDSFNVFLSTIHKNEWITPNVFFDIALSKYSLKPNYYTNNNKHKDGLKIILDTEVKEQLRRSLYPKNDSTSNISSANEDMLMGIDPCLF